MRYGLYVPNFGAFGDAHALADLAVEAEEAGWDGLFTWDHIDRDFATGGRLYVDGAQVHIFNPTNRVGTLTNVSPLIIARTGVVTNFWQGEIDEVEIFQRDLAASEVQALFNAGSFGKCKQ